MSEKHKKRHLLRLVNRGALKYYPESKTYSCSYQHCRDCYDRGGNKLCETAHNGYEPQFTEEDVEPLREERPELFI